MTIPYLTNIVSYLFRPPPFSVLVEPFGLFNLPRSEVGLNDSTFLPLHCAEAAPLMLYPDAGCLSGSKDLSLELRLSRLRFERSGAETPASARRLSKDGADCSFGLVLARFGSGVPSIEPLLRFGDAIALPLASCRALLTPSFLGNLRVACCVASGFRGGGSTIGCSSSCVRPGSFACTRSLDSS